MIRELYKYMDKTFDRESEVNDEVKGILTDGEEIRYAFESKDLCQAIFTTKRLMIKEKGSREKLYSIPYSSVLIWESEKCADTGDKTAEVTLWTSLEKIKVNLFKDADVRGIDEIISKANL